jgi:hypothetical protein
MCACPFSTETLICDTLAWVWVCRCQTCFRYINLRAYVEAALLEVGDPLLSSAKPSAAATAVVKTLLTELKCIAEGQDAQESPNIVAGTPSTEEFKGGGASKLAHLHSGEGAKATATGTATATAAAAATAAAPLVVPVVSPTLLSVASLSRNGMRNNIAATAAGSPHSLQSSTGTISRSMGSTARVAEKGTFSRPHLPRANGGQHRGVPGAGGRLGRGELHGGADGGHFNAHVDTSTPKYATTVRPRPIKTARAIPSKSTHDIPEKLQSNIPRKLARLREAGHGIPDSTDTSPEAF